MNTQDGALVIAQPASSDQLVLLFHGMGGSPNDLVTLGQAVVRALPAATMVSVQAPHPSQLGRGWEWFPIAGITDANRPQRIAQAMPLFLQAIAHWQGVSGIGPDRTVLVGFSQGAIMSLESTQSALSPQPAAHTLIAMAGRLAEPARRAPGGVRVHLIHGEEDQVVPARCSVEAELELRALGGEVTLDLVPGLGHGIDARMVGLATRRLQGA